jgi:hypothetical protein
MKKNLKVGDKVIIKLSAEYNGDCNITEHMRGYDKREAEIVSITTAHSDGTNRYKLDVDNECFYYVDEWLEPIKKSKKKYKPKYGDKVELVFKYDTCGGLTGAVKGKKYYGVIRKDGAVEFYKDQRIDGWANSKGEMLCWHVNDLDVKMQLVECDPRCIVIPIDDWQRIYDVACDAWKKKLYEKVAPFAKAVTIDEEFAQSMLKASNASQLAVVKDVLSSAGYGVENVDDYFDFNDEHVLTHRSVSSPMYIRYGVASSEYMANKEIGFAIDFEVILVEDGVERTIGSKSYLKFKKK